MTFPILCPKGEIWIHIKKLHQEKNAHGDSIITGSIQIVDSPETTKSEQAAALRINNLLYQLNNISYTSGIQGRTGIYHRIRFRNQNTDLYF